jgi:hypothetical protein
VQIIFLKNLYPASEETLIVHYKMASLMLHREPVDGDSENGDPDDSVTEGAGLLHLDSWGPRVRILLGLWISACCECCVLSGRSLCFRPILCPEVSYCVCVCVCVCVCRGSDQVQQHLFTDKLSR